MTVRASVSTQRSADEVGHVKGFRHRHNARAFEDSVDVSCRSRPAPLDDRHRGVPHDEDDLVAERLYAVGPQFTHLERCVDRPAVAEGRL